MPVAMTGEVSIGLPLFGLHLPMSCCFMNCYPPKLALAYELLLYELLPTQAQLQVTALSTPQLPRQDRQRAAAIRADLGVPMGG